MSKLNIEYYISDDEEVVYAVEQKYGLFIAVYNKSVGKWILEERLNEMMLLHDDDVSVYGENGAMEITHNVYPDDILNEAINQYEELDKRVEQTLKEAEEIIKANEGRFKG